MRIAVLIAALSLLISCGSSTTSSGPPPKKAEQPPPRPRDETRRFPMANLVDSQVVVKELMGKPFMPGGTLAHYKKGKTEYDMFVAKLPSAADAATTLPDWRNALKDAKLVPAYGGYFGLDNGTPVFVFSKGPWIAGVRGLNEKDADAAARPLASKLDF